MKELRFTNAGRARFVLCCGLAISALSTAIKTLAQDLPQSLPSATSTNATIAAVDRIIMRDAQGRAQSFFDSRNRLFEVSYDEAGKVSSVRTPGRRNRADVSGIAYTADGKLVAASLGDGNMLTFSYDADGTQYVRDRYGALIRRLPASEGSAIFSEDDPTGTLKGTVERLEALLATLTLAR